MPTRITTRALPNNTYSVTFAFTDEDGDAVTPNAGCTWTLRDYAGNVINSRSAVDIVEAASVEIALSGDDLAAQGVTDNGIRVITVDGDYDSDLGSGLPLDQSASFVISDVILPVSLQEAKEHLRIDDDNTDHDFDIAMRLTAAREWVEIFCRRKLITQTVTKYFHEWPSGDHFVLPYGQLQSVSSIKYKDTDGDQTTWDSSEYIVDTDEEPGRVVLGYGESWPSTTLYPTNAIEIIYSCGYGAYAGSVPEMIKSAIKLHLSDYFENRESIIIGAGLATVKLDTIKALLWPYRVWLI